MPIFDNDFETMPREGLEAIQLRRLQTMENNIAMDIKETYQINT